MIRSIVIRYLLLATFSITVAHSVIPHHHFDEAIQLTAHEKGDCNTDESRCTACCEMHGNHSAHQHCHFKTENFTNKHDSQHISVYVITISNTETPNLDEKELTAHLTPFIGTPLDGMCRSASLRAPPIFS